MDPVTPDLNGDDFTDFLRWMVGYYGFATEDVIYCMERPEKYGKEYARYLSVGGPNRED